MSGLDVLRLSLDELGLGSSDHGHEHRSSKCGLNGLGLGVEVLGPASLDPGFPSVDLGRSDPDL